MKTYKAILHDNQIEWSEHVPDKVLREKAITIYVTIPDEPITPLAANEQGQAMAAALERLAASNALAEITDPTAWQRETRQDRALPDRQT